MIDNKLFSAIGTFLLLSSGIVDGQEQQQSTVKNNKKTAPTYVIESQVQGSQEQPKVIYITPWQEFNSTLSIDDHELNIRFPTLAPVNPTKFRDKVNHYYREQSGTIKEQ